ncbi:claudin-34 [Sander lucioperca]|uniref:claudin-34 n=1 Tax=Sander lucioperca TaxID=283035 RepID=UPI00125D73E7|nr:claudin-34 [Sander lucioperca]XP_035863455.1 claudin-34 [Sander lucioperca]
MIYLAHTAHWQFLGLMAGAIAWILILTTTGLNEWRLWYVADESVITSGVAWVGIWRACFYSHVLPRIENCQSIGISDHFAPAEISVAQVLMVLALICGLVGNITAAVAVRMVYFSIKNRRNVRLVFVLAGTLYVLTGTLLLVPLVWNMSSVLKNSTIGFPPEFHLPAAPVRQQVGSAIGVGIFASILMLISGVLFLCYCYAWEALSTEAPRDTRDPLQGSLTETTLAQKSELPDGTNQGRDNPAFHTEEIS